MFTFLSLVAAAAEKKSELNVVISTVQGLGLLLERGSNFGRMLGGTADP